MVRPYLPLNALRAFEASARHLSFTKAAIELCVTQAAVSHQVKLLEQRLGSPLFLRLPRGLKITEEGLGLLPTLRDSFDRMADMLERFEGGHMREVLTIGVVGTFATGWFLPRLRDFQQQYPYIDIRLSTNNNRVDIAAEGLDYAIRFGNGAWHDTEADGLFEAPLSALCLPAIAATLSTPQDLAQHVLLRSYRASEWPTWFEAAGIEAPPVRGPVFDSSVIMMEAALQGMGVALAPPLMFGHLLEAERITQPFKAEISLGRYWLTKLKSRSVTAAMNAFRLWLLSQSGVENRQSSQ